MRKTNIATGRAALERPVAVYEGGEMSPSTGLSEAEAARRLSQRGPLEPPASSRSYASIVRANTLTPFNLILAVAGGLTLAFGEFQDALFLGVLFFNTAIGITQEVRAKLALDRLAALVAPTGAVLRDGRERSVPIDEIVVGDLVRVQPGDQIVADGTLSRASSLSVDESILTGESAPVQQREGETVRSGSFVAEGTGAYEVTAVGPDSYAARITGQARAFRHPRSPLELAFNRLLFVLVAVMVPLGGLAVYTLWQRHTALDTAVPKAVAEVVTLVPEGLILLASLTYAVAALRMARRGALAQQLNAIESLASVDVICLDKTGTLTDASLRVVAVEPAAGCTKDELAAELGRYASGASVRNATLQAIARAYPQAAEAPASEVPFSSERRWGAADGLVLGAPELFALGPLGPVAEREAGAGRRVLALGRTADADAGPVGATLLGLVVLAEELRANARATVEFFLEQGVELKVISGDRPETVAAIAADVGLPLSGSPLDGSSLPESGEELRAAVQGTSVIGRISPDGKRRIVESLRDGGRYVAMIGDGVNDVPALKAARLAIAQGTGTQMAKSVADLVLVHGDFGSVPPMVAEGRKVLRNLQRVTKLFVTKSAFAVFLILSIGLTPIAYPLLPRHLTLAASLTIGIPSFFLALARSAGPFRPVGFLREVSRFAVPAGTAAGLGVLASYLFALDVMHLHVPAARTVATTALVLVGLFLVLSLEAAGRRRGAAVSALCIALLGLYALVLALPWSRDFFELVVPGVGMVATAVVGAGIAVAGLWLTDERFVPGRPS